MEMNSPGFAQFAYCGPELNWAKNFKFPIVNGNKHKQYLDPPIARIARPASLFTEKSIGCY
jgi:hypothetical protein